MLASPDEMPFLFTELPPDRADAAPEKPDLLSNVTSQARDRVPDGHDETPRLEGQGDTPAVGLAADATASRPAAGTQPPSTEPTDVGAAVGGEAARTRNGESLAPVPDDDLHPGSAGNSTTDQMEMAHPGGNAGLLGDVSLNTTAWDYAPWLQRFAQQLRERWYAPPAYSYGILKEGGWALLEIEVSRSGKPLRLDLLAEQGHPSLIRAAQSALRSMSPIEPLPKDFPEPTLVLRIRMIYPEIRRR